MKAESAGNGFSTLEIMIAMTIMSIVLVGAITANYAAQYWSITSQTSNEGLYKAKTKLEDLRALVKQDFYQAMSTAPTRSMNPADPHDASCIAGGLCYYVQSIITDLSSCSKYVQADVSWQVSGYSTTTTSLFTNLTNSDEAIALGGDCILNQPAGHWDTNVPQSVGASTNNPGKVFTAIDVLHKEIYVTASTSPYFLVYNVPTAVGQNPTLNPTPAGSPFVDPGVAGSGIRFNDVDAIEDLATGRTYAFVAENSTTTQLEVFDVTDPTTPTFVIKKQLQGITYPGVYSEGWKVFVYGNRLYMTTRETSGNEFHIFNINDPTQPTEIGNGFKLTRTVNDMIVRDQKVGNTVYRFVFLAAQADLKRLGVLDVTNDVITELDPVIAGEPDGNSLSLAGHNLYMGTDESGSGPELTVVDVTDPITSLPIIGSAEVGANVTALRVSGEYAYLGTDTGQIQVWDSDYTKWDPDVLNSSRLQYYPFAHLAPTASYGTPMTQGFDIDGDWIYAISQWKNAPGDALQVLYTL